jgi:hypothetical protein
LHELKVLMRALGFDIKKPEVVKLVHGESFHPTTYINTVLVHCCLILSRPHNCVDIDPSNVGSVDYEQFLEISEQICELFSPLFCII